MGRAEARAAAANAVQVLGAYGFSDEYPVERFYRNSKGASSTRARREVHTLMQADYVLGFREDKARRVRLPAYAGGVGPGGFVIQQVRGVAPPGRRLVASFL